ncbi:MAG: hypothetical protein RR185_05280 [Angelakisella sp.]
MYLLILPAVIYLLVFCYQPMYGVLIAFKDFKPSLGVWGSPWVGLKHFIKFFNSESFMRTLSNTLLVSIYSLLAGFPIPILLALAMNAVNVKWFKKIVQTVTYAPHFISVVVIVGMIDLLFSPGASGLVNNFLGLFGVEPIFIYGQAGVLSTPVCVVRCVAGYGLGQHYLSGGVGRGRPLPPRGCRN